MLLPECALCLQTPSPAARNQASLYKPVGHGGGGGSHSSCSVPRPASLDATRQRATSFSHPFFRFVPRKHKNHVSSGHRGSSQSSSQLLFTYVLTLISASACVCSFVYEHGASVCVCVHGCASGTRVEVTVTAGPGPPLSLLCQSSSTDDRHEHLTFKEGSGVSNSVP